MRLAACMGLGRERAAKAAYKTAEIEAQKEEASAFRADVQREARALIDQLRAQARLRGGEGDEYPRSSH